MFTPLSNKLLFFGSFRVNQLNIIVNVFIFIILMQPDIRIEYLLFKNDMRYRYLNTFFWFFL